MVRHAVRAGVIDIGSNSVRLLVVEDRRELGRWVEITGLGKGVDATGLLSREAIETTLAALRGFAEELGRLGVERRVAIATSASRDASNRAALLDAAEGILGVRPEIISGEREGELAYRGATSGLRLDHPVLVSDIGGGSTELVASGDGRSIDIGSVRLTDRLLPSRPPTPEEMESAREHLAVVFAEVGPGGWRSHVGVAGTWTSVAAIAMRLPAYRPGAVHGSRLSRDQVDGVVERLTPLTVAETRQIPGLDPRRAPVILAGAMIARTVMEKLEVPATIVSERDTLDGAAMELTGIA